MATPTTSLDHLIDAVSVVKEDADLGHDMLNLLLSIRTFRKHLPPKGNYSRVTNEAFGVVGREMQAMMDEYKASQERPT